MEADGFEMVACQSFCDRKYEVFRRKSESERILDRETVGEDLCYDVGR
jgi:hypothetical protein